MKKLLFVIALFLCSPAILAQDYWEQKDSVKGPPKSAASAFTIGSVGLVVCGLDEVEFKRKSYVYSPFHNDWDETSPLGGDFGDGLQRASACGFSIENNGATKGYIALGQAQTVPFLNDLWEFDPVTESWSQKADFIGQPRRQAASFVIGSKAYVGTGESAAGLLKDFFVYDAQTNSWDQISDFVGSARRQAVAFTLAGKGFLGTGDDGIKRKDFWMYNPQTDQWILKAEFPGIARSGACAWASGPTAFIATGEGADFSFLNDLYEYNYYTNSWVQRASLPGAPRKNAIAFCVDGVGYVGAGYNNQFLDDFYAYNQLVGSDELDKNQVDVSINLTQNGVFINSKNDILHSVLVVNSLGQEIQEINNIQQANYFLKTQDFPVGTYYVSIKCQSLRTTNSTIVKL